MLLPPFFRSQLASVHPGITPSPPFLWWSASKRQKKKKKNPRSKMRFGIGNEDKSEILPRRDSWKTNRSPSPPRFFGVGWGVRFLSQCAVLHDGLEVAKLQVKSDAAVANDCMQSYWWLAGCVHRGPDTGRDDQISATRSRCTLHVRGLFFSCRIGRKNLPASRAFPLFSLCAFNLATHPV